MLLRRRASTALYKLSAGVISTRWILLSMVLAAVGILGLIIAVPPAVNIALAIVSVALIVPEIAEFVQVRSRIQFQERTADTFGDVRQWAADRPRFDLIGHRTGTFLLDRVVSEAVRAGLPARLDEDRYQLPEELRLHGRRFLQKRIAGRIDVFNGAVVGLDTNVGVSPELATTELRFVHGTYFDHLASNLFAARDVHLDRRHRSELGRSLVIDRHGAPRDFGDSWLLNATGTSMVAITNDGWIVNVHQTAKNESAQDELAPSGSGSLEPRDFPAGPFALADIAARGGVREMDDEAGIGTADVAETAFLGFGRWLEKGGKPELLSLARLTIDSHGARRRRSAKSDRPFSKFAEPARLILPVADWEPTRASEMVEQVHARALSLPLFASLVLMAEAVHGPPSAARDLLYRAMASWRR
jgi:hypothetical protein